MTFKKFNDLVKGENLTILKKQTSNNKQQLYYIKNALDTEVYL